MCCCSDYRRALIPKASLVLSPYQLTAKHTSLRLGGEKSMSIDGFGTAVPLPKAFFPKKRRGKGAVATFTAAATMTRVSDYRTSFGIFDMH